MRDFAGVLSLCLSTIAATTVFAVAFLPFDHTGVLGTLLVGLSLLCAPIGCIFGVLGWRGRRRRLARWGVSVGLVATLYIPTILFSLQCGR